jgi:hypothetical protein
VADKGIDKLVVRRGLPRFPALLRQGRAAFAQTGDNRRPSIRVTQTTTNFT